MRSLLVPKTHLKITLVLLYASTVLWSWYPWPNGDTSTFELKTPTQKLVKYGQRVSQNTHKFKSNAALCAQQR